MPAATITRELVLAATGAQGNFDFDNEDVIKAVIRAGLGLKRVSAELVQQFRDFEDDVEVEAEEEPETDADDDEEEEQSEGRSVVKRAYKSRYRPFKATCGDELARLVREHLAVKTEDGVRIDTDRLRTFAVANACWVSTYSNLNVGMQRMNVVNRLRAKVKKGHDIVWA